MSGKLAAAITVFFFLAFIMGVELAELWHLYFAAKAVAGNPQAAMHFVAELQGKADLFMFIYTAETTLLLALLALIMEKLQDLEKDLEE